MNYMQLTNKRLFHKLFMFLDVKDYLSARLIVKYNIKFKVIKEFRRTDTDYVIIVCKIKKSEVPKFMLLLKELENNMYITGHNDCNEFWKEFKDLLYKEARHV